MAIALFLWNCNISRKYCTSLELFSFLGLNASRIDEATNAALSAGSPPSWMLLRGWLACRRTTVALLCPRQWACYSPLSCYWSSVNVGARDRSGLADPFPRFLTFALPFGSAVATSSELPTIVCFLLLLCPGFRSFLLCLLVRVGGPSRI